MSAVVSPGFSWSAYMSVRKCLWRKPASWLVAVCERSENRGSGGGGWRKGTKSCCAPVTGVRKRSILRGYVPLGNLLTMGYRFPLGPLFWWPEKWRGCSGKYLFSRPFGEGGGTQVCKWPKYIYFWDNRWISSASHKTSAGFRSTPSQVYMYTYIHITHMYVYIHYIYIYIPYLSMATVRATKHLKKPSEC